jgi:hypothetical protein
MLAMCMSCLLAVIDICQPAMRLVQMNFFECYKGDLFDNKMVFTDGVLVITSLAKQFIGV